MLVILLSGVSVFIALKYKKYKIAGLLFGISAVLQLLLYGVDTNVNIIQFLFGIGLPALSVLSTIIGVTKGIKNFRDKKGGSFDLIIWVIVLLLILLFVIGFIGIAGGM